MTDTAYTRLNVNINPECEEFLRSRIDTGCSATETVRRALSLLRLAEEAWAAGGVLSVLMPDGTATEVLDLEAGR